MNASLIASSSYCLFRVLSEGSTFSVCVSFNVDSSPSLSDSKLSRDFLRNSSTAGLPLFFLPRFLADTVTLETTSVSSLLFSVLGELSSFSGFFFLDRPRFVLELAVGGSTGRAEMHRPCFES
eukprot:Gb_08389 [translate_table: standard]